MHVNWCFQSKCSNISAEGLHFSAFHCFRNDDIRYKIYPVYVPESISNFFTNVTIVIILGLSVLTHTRMVLVVNFLVIRAIKYTWLYLTKIRACIGEKRDHD